MTSTERAVAARLPASSWGSALHDFARVLAHEWPGVRPDLVAGLLWRALEQPTRDAEIIHSIGDAYDVYGPYLQLKYGRLPRAVDACEGVSEWVRDIAEAEAQRKLADSVMLERDREILDAPVYGFTVQSWAIAMDIPFESYEDREEAHTMDQIRKVLRSNDFFTDKLSALFGVDTSAPVNSGANPADSDGMATTVDATTQRVPAVLPYLEWIAARKADEARFLVMGETPTFELIYDADNWVLLQRYDNEITLQYTGDSAYPEFVDHLVIPPEQRAELFEALCLSGSQCDLNVRDLYEFLDVDANELKPIFWLSSQDSYDTIINLALKFDEMYEDPTLPAHEAADQMLEMLTGAAVLEKALDGLPEIEPEAGRALASFERAEGLDYGYEKRDVVLGILRGYLTRYIQLERERPDDSITAQDTELLARRVRHGFDSVARYACTVAKITEMSSQVLADHLVGNCLTAEQRKLLDPSGVDDCWGLANRLYAYILRARAKQ